MYDEALVVNTILLKFAPNKIKNNVSFFLEQGKPYQKLGNYNSAELIYNHILESDPENHLLEWGFSL
jgi:tetratricopeptide (TPR) repeat protein